MRAIKPSHHLKLLITAAVSLLFLGAAPGPSPERSATEQLTFAGGEVSVAYPSSLSLAVTPEQLTVRATIPPCDEYFDYCFYLPESAYAGTNLSAAGLRVEARPDLGAEIACLLAQPDGYRDLQPGVVRALEQSSSRFAPLGEGAAGSYSEGEVRRLWLGGDCLEFEVRLVLTRFENYDPGTVAEFTVDDQAALKASLASVLDGATSRGAKVVWPLAGHSQLEAFIQPSLPAAGATVTSPLKVSGEAVGNWLFEGSFPLQLIAADGEVIATSYATSSGNWMTTDFVPFEGAIEFEVKRRTDALLVFRRDNPSGLPQHDAAVHLPLVLEPR